MLVVVIAGIIIAIIVLKIIAPLIGNIIGVVMAGIMLLALIALCVAFPPIIIFLVIAAFVFFGKIKRTRKNEY